MHRVYVVAWCLIAAVAALMIANAGDEMRLAYRAVVDTLAAGGSDRYARGLSKKHTDSAAVSLFYGFLWCLALAVLTYIAGGLPWGGE